MMVIYKYKISNLTLVRYSAITYGFEMTKMRQLLGRFFFSTYKDYSINVL